MNFSADLLTLDFKFSDTKKSQLLTNSPFWRYYRVQTLPTLILQSQTRSCSHGDVTLKSMLNQWFDQQQRHALFCIKFCG